MDRATRDYFEPRFGADFSGVRIHAGGQAEETARAINAHAYTLGSSIVFGAGEYQPETEQGKHLLAHELTHVVQQGEKLTSFLQREAKPAPETITSEAVEGSPGPRTRTTIGVGEQVRLTHSPGDAHWAASDGNFTFTTDNKERRVTVEDKVIFNAPDTEQRKVIVAAGGATIVFTVIAPTGIHMERVESTGVKHDKNRADSGIAVQPFLLPDTVNFSSVKYRELNVGAVVTDPGAYSCFSGVGHCRKKAGGACNDVQLTKRVVAGKGTQADDVDCAYSGDCEKQTPPFTPGSITFTIPHEYRVGTGAYHQFCSVTQQGSLAADRSTLIFSKGDATGRTTVAAPSAILGGKCG